MENRPNKEQERRKVNKSNITMVKTFLKKIRIEGYSAQFESIIRRVGKGVIHANKISRLISRSIAFYMNRSKKNG